MWATTCNHANGPGLNDPGDQSSPWRGRLVRSRGRTLVVRVAVPEPEPATVVMMTTR